MIVLYFLLAKINCLVSFNSKILKRCCLILLFIQGSSMKDKEHLESIIDVIDDNAFIVQIDTEGAITDVSKAFCEETGYTKDEFVGKHFSVLASSDEKITKDIWDNITHEIIWKGELKSSKKNGKELWIQATISPRYVEHHVEGYVLIGYDITYRKNLEKALDKRVQDLHKARAEVEHIHKQTKDSIEFASFLQTAITPPKGAMNKYFSDHFVIWHPKDIVGGDIWLFDDLRHDDECLFMCIDCTGHGVPGAFVTMIVKSIEREIVAKINEHEDMDVSPAWILSYFNKAIKQLLKQEDENSSSLANAGFDGGVIYYNRKEQIIKFAGAETPLFYLEDGKIKVIKGDRYSVGYKKCDINYQYKEHIIPVKKGMRFYITTDGYLDQNGGEKGFPFGKKRFKKLLEDTANEPMAEQQTALLFEMMEYQYDEERNDDVTVIGFEI
jgi:PAS domain S-box-containing protein